MDAAHKLIKNIAFLLAALLLVVMPGRSQSLSASPNPVALTGTTTSVQVTTSGSGAYTLTPSGGFFSVSGGGHAPDSFTVSLANTACSNGGVTCAGSITLHPTSVTGTSQDYTVSVTFTPGSGPPPSGSGPIVPSQSSVTFNTFTGQAVSTSLSLTTTSATPISFNYSYTPTNSWLSVTVNSQQVSGASSVTMNVYANATNISTQQTGSITITPLNGGAQTTIPVTLNVNGSGGSTYSVSPTSFTLAYPNGPTSQQVVIFNGTGVTTYNASVTNCNSTNFLFLTGGTQSSATQIINQPNGSNLTVTLNSPGSLATNTYTCQIVVSNPSNSSDQVTISVTLTVNGGGSGGGYTLNPTILSFISQTGSTNTQQSFVSVSSSTQSTYNAAFTSSSSPNGTANWITLNSSTQTSISGQPVGNGLNIGLNNPASFAVGNYTGTVTITPPSGTGSATITINLTVNTTGTVNSSYSVAPSSLSLFYPNGQQTGNAIVTSSTQTQFFAATSVNGGVANWLNISQSGLTSGAGQSFTGAPSATNPVVASLNLFQLPQTAGTYTGQIKISNPNNANDFVTVSVTLTMQVNIGGGNGYSASPTSLSFNTPVGVVPNSQSIAVTVPNSSTSFTSSVTGSNGVTFVYSPCNGCSYTGSQNLAVQVNPGNLPSGTYTNTITLTSNGNSFAFITVTLAVGTSGTTNSTLAAPSSLSFFYQSGQGSPPAQVITIAPSGSFTASSSQSWIALSTTQGNGPGNITVSLIPQGFSAGSFNTGVVTINTPNGSVGINVSLTVSSGLVLFSNPGSVNLSTPTYQSVVQITASDNSTQPVTINTTTSWLTLTSGTNNATTPTSFLLTVNPAGLCNGLNTGSITASSSSAANNPLTIPVTVLISGAGSNCGTSGSVTASPTSLSFTAQTNGSAPSAQNVQVTGTSAGISYVYQVSTQSGGNWLSSSVNGSTVANGSTLTTQSSATTFAVSVNPSGLSAGTYNGTLSFGGTNVSVTLTVQANTISATPSSLSFTYSVGGSVPASQAVSVSGATTGLAFGVQISAGNCSSGWLAASPTSGTTPGTVNVSVNPNGLAAGTCNGTVTISGTGGATGSTTVTVSLTVSAPLPTITQVGSAASYLGTAVSPGEIITIFGTGLGPTPFVTLALDATGKVATTLCPPLPSGTNCTPARGIQVLVAGFPAPMVFAGNTQVSAVVPYEVAPLHGSQPVVVKFLGQTSNAIGVQIAPTAPGIFTANASGTGPGAILNQNQSVNSPTNRAAKGSVVSVFMTGEGLTSPALASGSVVAANLPPPQVTAAPLLPVAALVDGQPAAIQYAGEAPGLVAGVLQVNVVIPAGARTGDLPVIISLGGTSSQTGVTVSVQ